MNIISKGKYIRSSAQKLRLVANLIRGKNVYVALNILSFVNKKSSLLIKKVLLSALANAKNNFNCIKEKFIISRIFIDNANLVKRVFPRAKGKIDYICKRSSHITIYISNNL